MRSDCIIKKNAGISLRYPQTVSHSPVLILFVGGVKKKRGGGRNYEPSKSEEHSAERALPLGKQSSIILATRGIL